MEINISGRETPSTIIRELEKIQDIMCVTFAITYDSQDLKREADNLLD
jgi:hypothetical protein